MLKILLIHIVMAICLPAFAQDYFVIIKKNDKQSYRYPPNAKIYISGESLNRKLIEKDEALTFKGDYTLEIEVPWSSKPEIIKSKGGELEVFVLPQDSRKGIEKISLDNTSNSEINLKSDKNILEQNKPKLIKSTVTKSDKILGTNNLSIQFSDDLVFRYEDGKVSAWQNGKNLEVVGHYLVQTPQGLLKLSFNPKNGETWWVFEIN